MKLTVVGSADAFNSGGRSHSCYILEGEDFETTMVDFGATAQMALARLGRKACDIQNFVFTHLHGDHFAGTPFLIIDSLFKNVRRHPLNFFGPPGIRARLFALLDATYGTNIIDRPEAPEIRVVEFAAGEHVNVGGLRVDGYLAAHMEPPNMALCLRFTCPEGRSVSFSGDTEMCEGLLSAAAEVDLLVAECSGLAPPIGRHCTWEDWLRVLPTLDAGRVLLTHLSSEVRGSIPRLLEEAPRGPPLGFADDGVTVQILPRAVNHE